jgi:NAD(P)-dependent dehydrogenase (short-subunit alcohol dehydrogenase family)
MVRFKKRAAIVTGGAKRIGRAISLMLADKGYNIALHYNTSEVVAKKLASEIKAKERDCYIFQSDLENYREVVQLIPAVFKCFPETSLLVNNASVFKQAKFVDTIKELYDTHFNVNLRAPFFLTQYFAKMSSAEHIINILDTRIASTSTEHFAYTMTKKALYEFTKMAAKELGPRIRVNSISPGLILPPTGKDESYLQQLSKVIPLKKKGGSWQHAFSY